MQNQNNKNKLLIFGFLAATIASMAFMVANGGVRTALAQGSNDISTSGMKMTGTEGGGGTTNKSTVARDSVTILLEGKSIPGKGFIHLYDSTP
jgi:hypothetical protein